MKICAMSDVHNRIPLMSPEPADLLIIAGDLTYAGSAPELGYFNEALGAFRSNYKEILIVAGNHDVHFYNYPEEAKNILTNARYLEDEKFVYKGVRFYFSPWVPVIGLWAFEYPSDDAAREIWSKIPNNTDVLVTHGPPSDVGTLDWADNAYVKGPIGCPILGEAVKRVKPKCHIFGHIHEGYGSVEKRGTTFLNVSSLKRDYVTINPPVVFDI